ncbi:MAG: GTPase ObgE [bacterium]
MAFIDEIDIVVKGGDGGRGAVSFRREKFVSKGGPDGGDGGKGGDVYIEVAPNISTLSHLKGRRIFEAGSGKNGRPKKMTGANGANITIYVPRGTIIRQRKGGKVIAELMEYGDKFLLAKGGRGGRGNSSFATATMRAPRISENGAKGQIREYYLELRLIADVGLVGLPNAGKSTLLSNLTRATPKIADYPFTTIYPNLGVVWMSDYEHFIIADLPGLMEDSHKEVGLGERFLKHIERSGLICLVIDMAPNEGEVEPVKAIKILLSELESYKSGLSRRARIIVANKMDLKRAEENLKFLRESDVVSNLIIVPISALYKTGLDNFKNVVYNYIRYIDERTEDTGL